jgi:hypothetical protein
MYSIVHVEKAMELVQSLEIQGTGSLESGVCLPENLAVVAPAT